MEERASLGLGGTLCRELEVGWEMVVCPNKKEGETQSTCELKCMQLKETFSATTVSLHLYWGVYFDSLYHFSLNIQQFPDSVRVNYESGGKIIIIRITSK